VSFLGGLVLFIARRDQQVLANAGGSKSTVAAIAVTTMVIGLIVILVSLALGGGSNFARFLLGAVVVLNLIGDVYMIVKYSGNQRTSGIVSAVVALIVLYLLYGSEASKAYFARA
jgi:uncharacterized membrane protein YecN with MAPEG domain